MSAASGEPEGEGFLTRWARRKRAVAEAEAATAHPTAPAAPEALKPGSVTEPTTEVGTEAETEMIEPPSLDVIDKDFDVAHWLRQNVPQSWKLAALRRAWESDPAIRDYLDPARDYALDWNTPGGAPGYGPLSESDDVAQMIRDVFGEKPEPEPEDAAAEAPEQDGDSMPHQLSLNEAARDSDAATQQSTPGAQTGPYLRLSDHDAEEAVQDENPPESAWRAVAAAQNRSDPADQPARNRKRGGGATPV